MRKLFLVIFVFGVFVSMAATGMYAREAKAAAPPQQKNQPAAEPAGSPLTIMKISFDDIDEPQSRICLGITHTANLDGISKYTEKKSQTGAYNRNQFNLLVCEAGPCEQVWSAGFVYTDETGKRDTLSFTWKQIVFEGISPKGTVERTLLYCLNGHCGQLEDWNGTGSAPLAADSGRYHFSWAHHSLEIGRSDRH